FNPVTKIYYNLPIPGNVKIEIYSSTGQMIKELVNEFKYEGNYVADFDGSNLSSRVYFYKIQTNDFSQTKRMILLK
ncbi:MAG: T9SS type A sorting domain-containing protein, partial [Ignavibacteriae bacterium]|nr:T9SS type A sorting domain-containing protein [Ignavibacteriota bacterium]